MRYELKSMGAWAFVKVSFFLNLALGFAIGLITALFFGFIMAVASSFPFDEYGANPMDSDPVSPIFMLFLPFFYAIAMAIFNTLIGLIAVGVYNLIARLVGGFEFNLEPIQPESVPGAPASVRTVTSSPPQAYQAPSPPPPTVDTQRPTPQPPPPPTNDNPPRPDSGPENA